MFISHDSWNGGAEGCLFDLVSRIDKHRFNVYVNLPSKGALYDRLIENNINCFLNHTDMWVPYSDKWSKRHFLEFFKSFYRRISVIEEIIKQYNIDLVYSNTITCADGAFAAKHMGVPHVWHIHENVEGNNSIKSYLPLRLIYKIIAILASEIIVVSESVAKNIRSDAKSIRKIYNGVDIAKFSIPKSSFFRNNLGLRSDVKIIAQIGSVIPAKGVNVFVDAAELLLDTQIDKNIAFLVVGSGPDEFKRQINEKIQKSKFSDKFFHLGHCENIPQLMSELDVLVLASESEGFPRIIIEAMAAKKPVVSTRNGGSEEIIIDNFNGFLVPKNCPNDIAEKLFTLLINQELAERIAQNGHDWVMEHASMENYIDSIQKTLLDAINKTRVNRI